LAFKHCEYLNTLQHCAEKQGGETRLVLIERSNIDRCNGVALFLICTTLPAITTLRDHWQQRILRRDIELLFEYAFLPRRPIGHEVRIRKLIWSANDYERCLQLLGSGKQTINVEI